MELERVYDAAKERREARDAYLNATGHRQSKAALERWNRAEEELDRALDAQEGKTA